MKEATVKQLAVAFLITVAGLLVTTGSPVTTSANLAPAGAPEKLFRLGMTQAEMHAAFGEPQSYLDARAHLRRTRAEFLAMRGACLCWPLYRRKTARNEYEIMIFDTVDESASRLHPVIRVKSVRFTLDHDMTPEETLEDIAEAKALCAGHCTVQRNEYGEAKATRPEIDVVFTFDFSKAKPGSVESVSMLAKKNMPKEDGDQ